MDYLRVHAHTYNLKSFKDKVPEKVSGTKGNDKKSNWKEVRGNQKKQKINNEKVEKVCEQKAIIEMEINDNNTDYSSSNDNYNYEISTNVVDDKKEEKEEIKLEEKKV